EEGTAECERSERDIREWPGGSACSGVGRAWSNESIECVAKRGACGRLAGIRVWIGSAREFFKVSKAVTVGIRAAARIQATILFDEIGNAVVIGILFADRLAESESGARD